MSSRKIRREIKAFRESLVTITGAEMEEQGLVPPGYFYFDRVDIMEYQKRINGLCRMTEIEGIATTIHRLF